MLISSAMQAVLCDMNPVLTENLSHAKIAAFSLDFIRGDPLSKKHPSANPGYVPGPCKDWVAPEVHSRLNVCTKVSAVPFVEACRVAIIYTALEELPCKSLQVVVYIAIADNKQVCLSSVCDE